MGLIIPAYVRRTGEFPTWPLPKYSKTIVGLCRGSFTAVTHFGYLRFHLSGLRVASGFRLSVLLFNFPSVCIGQSVKGLRWRYVDPQSLTMRIPL